jgi:D-tyrosyl-tRNA(Tyr) deacylase
MASARLLRDRFFMRALIQRVSQASVFVAGSKISEISGGLVVFLGVETEDTSEDVEWLAGKIARLRIFPDMDGAMNRSLHDIGGAILVVSQFTLYASTKKGNRPSFVKAAPPEFAERQYNSFCQHLEGDLSGPVRRGVFGARMRVALTNDGPVSIWIDTKWRE